MRAKRIFIAIVCIFFALYLGWISLLGYLQGGIRIENPACVTINADKQQIKLAWYVKHFTDYWYTFESSDGKLYRFCYALPDWLEDIALDIVVSWPDQTCVLYMGEARGQHLIEIDFPHADWQ